MPMQQQNASFAKKFGGRIAAANEAAKEAPIDFGNRRLPGGIRNGIAKLSAMYTKQQEADDGKVPKGEVFFRASAIVISPKEHNGEKVDGMVTSQMFPICDIPEKVDKDGNVIRKAVALEAGYSDMQNLIRSLGAGPCPETRQTDPDDSRSQAYWFAWMTAMTDPQRKDGPIYISFSTRGWKSPKRADESDADYKKREEMVFETWHGLAKPEDVARNGNFDPASGVTERGASVDPAAVQPARFEVPPTGLPTNGEIHEMSPDAEADLADEVESLVMTAMGDPKGATPDGQKASARLEELAWANGWSQDQTVNAADWEAVGDMALNSPDGIAAQSPKWDVTVGSKHKFCKRMRDGSKLRNKDGEFPPVEVEVVSVDIAAQTCTVKTKDGKEVVDVKSKKPIAVKFEWLE